MDKNKQNNSCNSQEVDISMERILDVNLHESGMAGESIDDKTPYDNLAQFKMVNSMFDEKEAFNDQNS